jgi:hypothetical protein
MLEQLVEDVKVFATRGENAAQSLAELLAVLEIDEVEDPRRLDRFGWCD